jgi:uncharacterized protein
MKPISSTKTLHLVVLAVFTALSGSCAQEGGGRGMPAEAREQIHTLLDHHAMIRRDLKLTSDGYMATTESDAPKVAAALKKHVKQMEERLASGLSVRRWDPAFAEYCDHYAEMEHVFTTTDKGVRMTVKGRTANSARIAQNHAKVVSAFAAHGWSEHDRKHDAVSR